MLSEKGNLPQAQFQVAPPKSTLLISPAESSFLKTKKQKNTPPYPRGNSKVNRVFQQSTIIK
jgi:hypothetical protein